MISFIGKCLLITEGKKKTLVLGDLHIGYEEYLNKSGVLVSREMFNEMKEYMKKVFERTGDVNMVVLLGDIKHEFGKISKQEWKEISDFLDIVKEKCKKIVIVKGNHDAIIEPIARRKEVRVMKIYKEGENAFMHGDSELEGSYDSKIKRWIVGHGHPAVKLGTSVRKEKYKCFLVGKYKGRDVAIVPSFFSLSAGTDARENSLGLAWKFDLNKFRVYVVEDESLDVLDFGKLGKLNH